MKKISLGLAMLLCGITATSQNPQMLKDVNPGAANSMIQQIVKTSNYTFFNAEDDDPDADRGLYRTDGTPAGTIKLNLSFPGYISTKADKLTPLGNKIVFAGDNFPNYGEIWASDGTQAGTVAIERFQPTTPNITPVIEIASMGSYAYYIAVNNSNKPVLKRTDGTVAGTSEVYNFNAYTGIAEVVFLTPLNNIMYFIVYDRYGTGVDQLWRSDGTTAGTYIVHDFGLNQYVASYIMPAGNNLYIMTVVPGTGNVLWKSDGTAAGSMNVKTIASTGNNNYPAFAAIGSTFYFAGLDANGRELWKSDGTAAGTMMVADIEAGAASSNPLSMMAFNNNLYFAATTVAEGNELWKFDGVTASLVKDINPGTANGFPTSFAVSNNSLLFRATTISAGGELWITDGTSANTLQVADINPGANHGGPGFLTPGNPVYFLAQNGINGGEIFKYDNADGINGLRKIYVNDNSLAGDIFTTAVGNNTNNGTRTSPVATISHALSIAYAGDTIIVDAGTYTEQVTIEKGITIKGAGATLTSILKPAVTVPPPGPFFEQGIFQTAQNMEDVHIRDLSITGDHTTGVTPVILQTGGSVRNCNLQNGNQGIFFRVETALKTVVAENNNIQAEYIGVNCAGLGMTASLLNNTITVNNPGFSAGIFAGQDFGSLPQFTATGNIISNFSYCGITINSSNANITQNSIVGTNGPAIQRSGGNTPVATCNWYGSALAATVSSKISGAITYSPWLINGTDNSPSNGFQSSPGSCAGGVNSFYVNDNSQAGNIFTTAPGNDANPGTFNAPFATLNHAINQVPAGATIYVDAGTYMMANHTINKAITILGTNYQVSPNNPADKTQYNTARNAESRITGGAFIIGADWILINGLRISSNTAISLNGDYSHIKFNKNYFDVASVANTVQLQGISTAPIVAFDFMATDNRFQRTDDQGGTALFLGAVKSLWIDDNVFIESGVFVNRSIAIRTSNTSAVESAAITNNYLKKLSNAISPSILQSTTISSNKFDSCAQGIIFTPFNVVSNNVFINSNTFTNLRVGRSVLIRGGASAGINNLNINGNTINQNIEGINGIVSMIQLEFAAGNTFGTANVLYNKINISGDYNLNGIGSNCGIQLTGKHTNTNIAGNELNFSAVNARVGLTPGVLPPVPAGVYINTDALPSSAVINIANNKITGFKQSVAFYDPVASTTPAVGYGYLATGAAVTINNNSFTGDSISIDNGTISQVVNATCNWYGSATSQNVSAKVSTSTVNYIPWLNNGTDNDPATGFQPVANACQGQPKYYVNDNVLAGDVFTTAVGNNSNNGSASSPFATPVYAYSIAQPGDSIFVDAGTYDLGGSTYSFPKPVVFLGTNYLVSPNDPSNKLLVNPARNAESVLANGKMVIASNGISMEGFTWDVGNRTGIELANTAATNNDFGAFKFRKNIFKITHTNANLNSFSITGKFVAMLNMPVTSGYTIEDNRFEKSGSATGNTLNFNYVKNISVANNSFVAPGATLRTQQAANLGGTGIIDGFVFSNNTVDEATNVVGGNRIAGALISGNKMHNVNGPLSNTNTMPESSNIEFSNNEVVNDLGTAFMLYNRTGSGTSNILKIENNIFTGVSVTGLNQLFASMNLTFSNVAVNPSFIIRGNKLTYSGDFSSVDNQFFRPITVRGNIANVLLENNEMTVNNTGTLPPANPAVLLPANPAFSIITDNGANAYMPANAVINVLNNKIHGLKQSVVFYDVSTNGRDTYAGYGNIPAGVTVNVNNNSFTGDSISINNGTFGQTVNANCNWYGSSAAQDVLPKISAATVNYIPWLVNGTDNDIATGFQPVPGSCNGTIPSVTFNTSTNVSCFAGNNGTISITITGGTAPYNFNWSRNGIGGYSSVEDPANLVAGTYDLLMTDANGSTDTLNGIVITEPTQLVATATGTSTSCSNSATVVATGGTIPYTYLWSNGATTATVINLPAGTYAVLVTDMNGCTDTASVTVTANEAFNPSASVADVSCFAGSNGSITVTNVNSTAPFTFSIDGINFVPGTLPYSFTNLAAGTYDIAVRDANGCTGFVTKTVNQPTLLSVVSNNIQSTCYGQSTGAINVTAAGGSGALSYSWTGPNQYSSTQRNISSLAAGSYTLTVTDNNGCTAVLNVPVPTFSEITVAASITNVLCRGGSTGAIDLTVSGGSGSFNFAWTGGSTSTAEDISNLAFGNYNVTITDAVSGCVVSRSYIITQPASNLSLATVKTNATGCNSLGTITATGAGGTSPYQYRLGNGSLQSSGLFANLYGGTYTVWVRDANGCTTSKEVIITDNGGDQYESNNSKNQAKPIFIDSVINARIATAGDVADWFRFVTPAGGGNFIMNLTHPSASFTFRMYPAGNNTPALIPVDSTATSKEYVLSGNATYYISITGATSYVCYELKVSPPLSFGETITKLNTPKTTAVKPGVVVEERSALNATAYPNPHRGTFDLRITSPETGMAKIDLFNANGQKLQEKTVSVQRTGTTVVPLQVAQHGTVFYRIQIGKYVITGKVIGAN